MRSVDLDMQRTTSLAAAVVPGALALASCVLTPSWGDSPSSRRDPIDFSGMASRANAPIRIQAWNHQTRVFDTIRSFTGTASRWASTPDLFGWNTVGIVLPDRYWSAAGCDAVGTGMANLRVQEIGTDGAASDLATFNAGGRDCIDDHLAAGEHPVTAGAACKLEDETIVLFTPQQCVFPTTADGTPPRATIRLTDNRQAWQVSNGAAELTATGIARTAVLTATAMARDPEGSIARVTLQGTVDVQCRRTSDGVLFAVPGPVSVTRTQTLTATVRAEIGLDATRVIDVNGLVTATCPAGTTFTRATGALFATGTNAAGVLSISPPLRFSI